MMFEKTKADTLPLHNNDEVITAASSGEEGRGLITPSSTMDENNQNSATANENDEDENELKKQAKKTTIMTSVVMALAASLFGLQLVAVATTSPFSLIVFLSCITGVCVSTTAGYKQYVLQSIESLRLVHNRIRLEVNQFRVENSVLTENVNDLEGKVNDLKEVEEQLNLIAEKQGLTADQLKRLVKENRETIDEQMV